MIMKREVKFAFDITIFVCYICKKTGELSLRGRLFAFDPST
jgi:hypothetical protein